VVKTLNKRYNAKIKLPIQFNYNHDKIFCKNKTPDRVWIDAYSTGWILLQHKLGFKEDTLMYNIGNFFERSQTVDKEDLTRFFNNNAKGILVNQILDDNFELVFESLKLKTIQMELRLENLSYSPNLKLVDVTITPRFLNLKGPYSELKKQKERFYIPLKIDSLRTDLKQTYYYNYEADSTITPFDKQIRVELVFKKHD
jgi:hypothetical protein